MSSYKTIETLGNTEWFVHDRFGMFIHWGLYSMPARYEWVKTNEQIPEEKYDEYFKYFDPDMYDPCDWAKRAKAAGMKYAVFTSKHHEGFCMFDSMYTDYKSTNTPCGRDLLREFLDAFRNEGLKVGIYYSLIDWHHPEFPIDMIHPRRNDPDAFEKSSKRDIHKYAKYMQNQLTELLLNYGKIDILWLDYSYPDSIPPANAPWMKGKGKDDWESEKLISIARKLQPGIIINNRSGIDQDIWTPEQYQPKEWVKHPGTGDLVTWEACHTFSGSWGYHRDESTWKSPEMLLQLLINTVSLGGNLLMNVGPTARGYFDKRACKALDVYAEWMKYNGRSIYGCTMAEPEFKAPEECRLTQKEDGSRLYIHLFDYPYKFLELKGFAGKVEYAQFLHDGSELLFREKNPGHFGDGQSSGDDLLVINLPEVKPDILIPVIELILK